MAPLACCLPAVPEVRFSTLLAASSDFPPAVVGADTRCCCSGVACCFPPWGPSSNVTSLVSPECRAVCLSRFVAVAFSASVHPAVHPAVLPYPHGAEGGEDPHGRRDRGDHQVPARGAVPILSPPRCVPITCMLLQTWWRSLPARRAARTWPWLRSVVLSFSSRRWKSCLCD